MEADEEDVLEGNNENSSVDKDSEIEKLKKEVVDLTRDFELLPSRTSSSISMHPLIYLKRHLVV